MRVLGWVVLSCLLAVVIASVQVAEDAYAAPGKRRAAVRAAAAGAAADMAAPDDGFLTVTPPGITIGSADSPPDTVRCKKGHVVSPYAYTVSYWDDQGRRHNVEFKVCPLCYIDNFRTMMVTRPTDVMWPAPARSVRP